MNSIFSICRGLGFRQGTVARCWSTASSPIASSALLTVCLPSADTSLSAVLSAALPSVSKSSGNILTTAIVVAVVSFAGFVFFCALKKALDVVEEEERIRREHRENKKRAEASNKKHQRDAGPHHQGGTHE